MSENRVIILEVVLNCNWPKGLKCEVEEEMCKFCNYQFPAPAIRHMKPLAISC